MPEKDRWHLLDVDKIFEILKTSSRGLKDEEVIAL